MLTRYIMISIWILRSALPRHHLLYKRSAFLISATEEKVFPREQAEISNLNTARSYQIVAQVLEGLGVHSAHYSTRGH
jgi:hypothetical protein